MDRPKALAVAVSVVELELAVVAAELELAVAAVVPAVDFVVVEEIAFCYAVVVVEWPWQISFPVDPHSVNDFARKVASLQ